MAIMIEIEKVKTKEILTIQTPFYFRFDLMPDRGESIIYGKITDGNVTTIQETNRFYPRREIEFEFSKEEVFNFQPYLSYLTKKEYKSSEEEYKNTLTKMKIFIEKEI